MTCSGLQSSSSAVGRVLGHDEMLPIRHNAYSCKVTSKDLVAAGYNAPQVLHSASSIGVVLLAGPDEVLPPRQDPYGCSRHACEQLAAVGHSAFTKLLVLVCCACRA
jgi:hypothetical protein